ncbi:MAG: hypothetical protein ACRD8A_07245 [Candidatus Acidiferrales bacterium]
MHTRILGITIALLALAFTTAAQNSPLPPPVPAPPALAAAKKVFISNGGGVDLQDALDFTIVKGGPDRTYDQFFAAMKSWGRYDLVSSPADADLILQISFNLSDSGLKGLASQSPLSTITPLMGQLRLVILDPKTHVALWTIAEYAQGAVLEGNREKNFNIAMDTVVDRLKSLVEPRTGATP